MFCTYCEDQGENGSFVSRCNNFRVDTLNAHELSEQHKSAKAVAESPAVQCCEAAKAIIIFRTAHYIVKHHMSFRSYSVICQLDKAKGVDVGESCQQLTRATQSVAYPLA